MDGRLRTRIDAEHGHRRRRGVRIIDGRDEIRPPLEGGRGDRVTARGIEVGHIFFSAPSTPIHGRQGQGPDGGLVPVQMGSYGIGVSRLVGAIIEASHDDDGIIWPASRRAVRRRPDQRQGGDAEPRQRCEELYAELEAAGMSVLYDDRDDRPGAKFAAIDLIGLPWQLIVGPQGVATGEVELKDAPTGERADARASTPRSSPRRLGRAEGSRHERRAPGPSPPFEWMVALRYLRARRKEGFISVIAGFSFLGIMLGVATLIIVMAVMNGFRQELFNKILGLNGHVVVHSRRCAASTITTPSPAASSGVPGVKYALPLIDGQVHGVDAVRRAPARWCAACARTI